MGRNEGRTRAMRREATEAVASRGAASGAGARTARPAGVDRRVVRSRRAIMQAFEELLAERPLDKITVSAIAQRADVDRKTFYQHFGSISGLIDALADDFAARVLDGIAAPDGVAAPDATGMPAKAPEDMEGMPEAAAFDTAPGAPALRMFFTALARNLSAGLVRERGFFEHMPADVLYDRLYAPFERQILARGLVDGLIAPDAARPALSFVLGGMLSLMRWWLGHGEALELDEVVALASVLTEHGLAGAVGRRGV